MVRIWSSFWVSIFSFILHLFDPMIKYVSRFLEDQIYQKIELNSGEFDSQKDEQLDSRPSKGIISDGFEEDEHSELSFHFHFLKSKDSTDDGAGKTECSVSRATTASKYQFELGNDFSCFMEEKETNNCKIEELFVGSNNQGLDYNYQNRVASSENEKSDFGRVGLEESEAIVEVKTEDPVEDLGTEISMIKEKGSSENLCLEAESYSFSDESQQVFENQFSEIDSAESDSNSEVSGGFEFIEIELQKSTEVGDEEKYPGEVSPKTEKFQEPGKEEEAEEVRFENKFWDFYYPIDDEESSTGKAGEFQEEEKKEMEEKVTEEIRLEKKFWDFDPNNEEKFPGNVSMKSQKFQQMDESKKTEEFQEQVNFPGKIAEKTEEFQEQYYTEKTEEFEEKTAEHRFEQNSWDFDSDDEGESDVLWEHQNLISKLKLEGKILRGKGLPTIMEESESPKMVDDLQPLKIEEKYEYKDLMEEIQMFYKSYAEKMRKLDILNHQTVHAISFLQLKDPIQLSSQQKYSISSIKSLLPPNFLPPKSRRIYADPTLKSVEELHRDLEEIYVAQICLSWEILRWQYDKVKELSENYDLEGQNWYNQIADEFQQFQVLLQRFVEDEPFQGPRFRNHVEQRSIIRSLLQVPMIKDDCSKDKKERDRQKKYSISIEMLAEIIEESIRVFWELLRVDKDETNAIHNVTPSELLIDIKKILHKKERRLNDMVRSENCVVKVFRKIRGGGEAGRLDLTLVRSHVELRLVSRVLGVSRLRDEQLVWCHKKLNSITFVGGRVDFEPSFLLFPC